MPLPRAVRLNAGQRVSDGTVSMRIVRLSIAAVRHGPSPASYWARLEFQVRRHRWSPS